jgi:hypothetical protein
VALPDVHDGAPRQHGADHMKLRTDATTLEPDILAALRTVRECVDAADGTPAGDAVVYLEQLAQLTLRLIRATNASKVKDIARTLEIKHRMNAAEANRGRRTDR